MQSLKKTALNTVSTMDSEHTANLEAVLEFEVCSETTVAMYTQDQVVMFNVGSDSRADRYFKLTKGL